MRERDHLKDSGADGKIILKSIFKKWNQKACFAEDRDRWRSLVHAVINIRVS
jgi:hypothetical protein